MDGLFICQVVGWKMIPPNRVGGKLFPSLRPIGLKLLGFGLFLKQLLSSILKIFLGSRSMENFLNDHFPSIVCGSSIVLQIF
jgi:hypothetical protein